MSVDQVVKSFLMPCSERKRQRDRSKRKRLQFFAELWSSVPVSTVVNYSQELLFSKR